MVIKRHHIINFLLLAMLIQLSPFDEYVRQRIFHGRAATNYIIVFTVLFLMFKTKKIPVNKNAFIIISILFCIFLINFIFAPYRNPSWFLYQFLFLLASLYTATIYSGIDSSDYGNVSSNINRICDACIPIIACISILYLVKYYPILVDTFTGIGSFNDYISAFFGGFYWDKNRIGGAMATIFCHTLTLPKHKFRKLIFLLPVLPIIAGIRHLLMGFSLTAALLSIRKIRIIFNLSLVFLITMFLFWGVFISILKKDVRVMGLANTVNIVLEYPFGVGHGVYHTYVKDNEDNLTGKFSYLGNYGFVPQSPQSDVIYVFGSLGFLCGLIFYTILVVMLLRLWRLYPNLHYPDKFFALVFIYFFFAGIFDSQMFCFSYWIVFGFALGVITAKRNRFIIEKTHPVKTCA